MNKSNYLKYKGYYGSVSFDEENETLYGKLEFIRDLVTYEGTDVKSLVRSFHESVDDYLEDCKQIGKAPDIPFKGSFNIRIPGELHQKIGIYAAHKHCSINNVVKRALEEFVEHHQSAFT